ncbi:MAG: BatA and WFA domain-containing protein [Candidatus Neomarinimicrobiota bacterium]
MTFLYPKLLWGLFSVLIPIMLHFIKRLRIQKNDEKPKLESLPISKKSLVLSRKKRDTTVIVIIRSLILTCLVLMFARPIQHGTISSAAPGDFESKAVLIIDNSASMAAKINEMSLLETSKQGAIEVINSFEGVTKIDVFMTSPFKKVITGTSGSDYLVEAIQQIPQSFGKDDLWLNIVSSLSEPDSLYSNYECLIFSDFQYLPTNSVLEQLRSLNAATDWHVFLVRHGSIQKNLSIRNVVPSDDLLYPGRGLSMDVTLVNDSESDYPQLPVELYLDHIRVGQVFLSFPIGATKEIAFQVFPERAEIISGSVEIPEDDFNLDNNLSFELSVLQQMKCKIIGSNEDDLFYLNSAISTIENYFRNLTIDTRIHQRIDQLNLDDTDVLLLYDPINISESAVRDLHRYLNNGGGIIWFDGGNLEKSVANSLQVQIGLPVIDSFIQIREPSSNAVTIDPAADGFFTGLPLLFDSEDLPRIFKYGQVMNESGKNSMLRTDLGHPLLLHWVQGSGKIVYFPTLLGEEWNDFTLKGSLLPILHRLILLVARNESGSEYIYAGDEKRILVPGEMMNKSWSLRTPSGQRILLLPDFNLEIITISDTYEIGHYIVLADQKPFTIFSTRLHTGEYASNRADITLVAEAFSSDRTRILSARNSPGNEFKNILYGRQLWRVFLILVLVLLILETGITRIDTDQLLKSIQK